MSGEQTVESVLALLDRREAEALERVRASERSLARHMDRQVKLAGALPPATVLPAHDIAMAAVELAEARSAYQALRMAIDDILRMREGRA